MAPRYQIKPQHEESGLYIFVLKRLVSKALLAIKLPRLLECASLAWGGGVGEEWFLNTNLESRRHPRCWVRSYLEQHWPTKKKDVLNSPYSTPTQPAKTEHPIYPKLHIPSMHLRGRIRWGYKFGPLSQKDPGLLLTGFVTFEKLLKPFKSQVPHL